MSLPLKREIPKEEEEFFIFYGTRAIHGPCSVPKCMDFSSAYVLSLTVGKNKYFNLCPTHEGVVLEKLVASYIVRAKTPPKSPLGTNKDLVFRHPVEGVPGTAEGDRQREVDQIDFE